MAKSNVYNEEELVPGIFSAENVCEERAVGGARSSVEDVVFTWRGLKFSETGLVNGEGKFFLVSEDSLFMVVETNSYPNWFSDEDDYLSGFIAYSSGSGQFAKTKEEALELQLKSLVELRDWVAKRINRVL